MSGINLLSGPIVITATPRGCAPQTLLTVAPSSQPPARMTLEEWQAWTNADQERMLRELEAWVGGLVLMMYERARRGRKDES